MVTALAIKMVDIDKWDGGADGVEGNISNWLRNVAPRSEEGENRLGIDLAQPLRLQPCPQNVQNKCNPFLSMSQKYNLIIFIKITNTAFTLKT